MQKQDTLKEVVFGYNEKVIIKPRMISSADEDDYSRQFQDIAESDDKEKQEFKIIKQFLIDVSAEMPEKLVKESDDQGRESKKPVRKPLIENAETIADAIQNYFAEYSVENFRVVSALYWGVKQRFQPSPDFL